MFKSVYLSICQLVSTPFIKKWFLHCKFYDDKKQASMISSIFFINIFLIYLLLSGHFVYVSFKIPHLFYQIPCIISQWKIILGVKNGKFFNIA